MQIITKKVCNLNWFNLFKTCWIFWSISIQIKLNFYLEEMWIDSKNHQWLIKLLNPFHVMNIQKLSYSYVWSAWITKVVLVFIIHSIAVFVFYLFSFCNSILWSLSLSSIYKLSVYTQLSVQIHVFSRQNVYYS